MNQSISTKLDKIKTKIFIHKDAAFLAALLCNLEVKVVESKNIAWTDGNVIYFGSEAIEKYPEEWLITYLTHELWHIARLHFLRGKGKNVKRWNLATDCVINCELIRNNYKGLEEIGACAIWEYEGYSEEEIYELLLEIDDEDLPQQVMVDVNPQLNQEEEQKLVKVVQNALMSAKDQSTGTINSIRKLLGNTLAPKVDWKKLLRKFCTEAVQEDTSWKTRSRRYTDIYMPGKSKEECKLTHLAFFVDTSGSISDKEIEEFNSEIKNIHKTLAPNKMTIVQFDEDIRDETVIYGDKPWKEIDIVGNGGTNLTPVRDWIVKNKPTACIVFSDLWCEPMEYIKTPMFWIIVNNDSTTPEFGKSIHIEV